MKHPRQLAKAKEADKTRPAERAQSEALLEHADKTAQQVHEESQSLSNLLSGARFRLEIGGVEQALRRSKQK